MCLFDFFFFCFFFCLGVAVPLLPLRAAESAAVRGAGAACCDLCRLWVDEEEEEEEEETCEEEVVGLLLLVLSSLGACFRFFNLRAMAEDLKKIFKWGVYTTRS